MLYPYDLLNTHQLNIAFFERRNSDTICAVLWEQYSTNYDTTNDPEFGAIYKTKWGVSYSVQYHEAYKMAIWIRNQLIHFYEETKRRDANARGHKACTTEE